MSATVTLETYLTLQVIHCFRCGVPFGITEKLYESLIGDMRGETFYCPNGHGQVFKGKSTLELLKEARTELAEAKAAAAREAASLRDARDTAMRQSKAERTRRKNVEQRVSAGTCPCCRRTFSQLARHMKSKHPEYGGGQ